MNPAIRLENVSVKLGGVPILRDVTACVPQGSVTAIIGPNGAGKTTLLAAILGLIPYSGRIALLGNEGRTPRIGYVPQRLDFDRGAPITVLDFLLMGRQRLPIWLGPNARLKQRAIDGLVRVQAERLLHRPLGKLSGGELQRVQLALALMEQPDIVLMDEPVSGVDVAGERLFCDILEQIQRDKHFTVVMVSHDLSVVTSHCTHVICLNQTLRCEGPAAEVLSKESLEGIYGPHVGIVQHAGHTHSHGPHCGGHPK